MALLEFEESRGSLVRALLLHLAAKLHRLDPVIAHTALVAEHPRQEPHNWQIPLQSAEELRQGVGVPLQVRRHHPSSALRVPARELHSAATAMAVEPHTVTMAPERRRRPLQRRVGREGCGHGGLDGHSLPAVLRNKCKIGRKTATFRPKQRSLE